MSNLKAKQQEQNLCYLIFCAKARLAQQMFTKVIFEKTY